MLDFSKSNYFEKMNALSERFDAKKRKNSYERFFEGYDERETVDSSGHSRILRIYSAEYYRAAVPYSVLVRRRVGYLAMEVLSICCFIYGAIQPSDCNTSWFIAAAQAACVASLALSSLAAIRICFAPEWMERRIYRESTVYLLHWSKWCAICLWILVLCVMLWAIISDSLGSAQSWKILFCEITASLLQTAIHFLEKKIPYKCEPNSARCAD